MPVDYSKWDALEVSDDSDIEVHPNVDKRSFIRAKQHQIHQERLQRKLRIEGLKYERALNDGLLRRISALLASLRAHAFDAETRNPGEVAFQAVMESAGRPDQDQPPPRPEGVHSEEKEPPTYSKMMAVLLDQVNTSLDEKKPDDRYSAMMAEVQVQESKVKELQQKLAVELDGLLQEEKKKITSEDIHVGFDSSHVNKASASTSSTKVELLNPEHATAKSGSSAEAGAGDGDAAAAAASGEGEDDMQASPDAQEFAKIKVKEYASSLQFLSEHAHILKESETDGILVMAFDAALERKDEFSQQCVHQALLLQYCRALGRDGVALFFKRITTKGHKAQEVFYKDVRETYGRIKKRSLEILAERAKEPKEGVEQIQLHALEPGTRIQISVPPADSPDEGAEAARRTYEGFTAEMRKALDSGELDEVNKVLAKMTVEEAEEVVRLLGEANILSMEEQIIDATTAEGKQQLKEMEASRAAGGEEEEEGRSEDDEDEVEMQGQDEKAAAA